MKPNPILHPFKALRWRKIKSRMDAIPGEPCGQPAHQCTNPRHMEYFNMKTKLLELEGWQPDL